MIDCEDQKILDITWDIQKINVYRALHFINCYLYVDSVESIKDKFEIVTFLRYLGVPDMIMTKTLKILFKSETIYSFLDYCSDVAYEDIFSFVADKYMMHNLYFEDQYAGMQNKNPDLKKFKELTGKILSINFPIQCKTRFLTKIIDAKIHKRFIMEIYVAANPCNNIKFIYKYFGQPTDFDLNYSINTGNGLNYTGIMSNGILIIDRDEVVWRDIIIKNIVAGILRQAINKNIWHMFLFVFLPKKLKIKSSW